MSHTKIRQTKQSHPVLAGEHLDLGQYQLKMKLFVERVQLQVEALIRKYEKQIRNLKAQNQQLRSKLRKHVLTNPEQSALKTDAIRNISPIKNIYDYSPSPSKQTNTASTFLCQTRQNFSLNGQQSQLNASRFEADTQRKKMHQQSIIHSLQAGRDNLDLNTNKLAELLGKNKPQVRVQEDAQSVQEKDKLSIDPLNSSLNSICESLDNSFHSKKSRKKHEARRKEKQRIQNLEMEQAKKNYQEKNEARIKNLLKNIRQAAFNTEQKQVLKLNNVSFIEKQVKRHSVKQIQKGTQKSKVLINPYPVDVSLNKSKTIIEQSPRKIQSILKTSNILTKSMQQYD